MKTRWKVRDAREREESKGNRTKRERHRERAERESETGELCSVVSGVKSENSNLVIIAHCCLHGRGGGVNGGGSRERWDLRSRQNSSLLKQHLKHLAPAVSTPNYQKPYCSFPPQTVVSSPIYLYIQTPLNEQLFAICRRLHKQHEKF